MIRSLKACDPGVAKSAAGYFYEGQLTWVGWIPSFVPSPGEKYPLDLLVIEKPRVYPGLSEKEPNDLIDVAEVVGWLRREIPHLQYKQYYPSEWKAQVKKWIHHDRIWSVLLPSERALFPSDTYDRIQRGLTTGGKNYISRSKAGEVHNQLDAVGIGLTALGRIGVGGRAIRL